MEVVQNIEGSRAVVTVKGRLDAKTSPELQTVVDGLPEAVTELVLDFEELEYISSAGLRVIQSARRRFSGTSFILRKVTPVIMEILTATGFASLLTFE